MPSFTRSTLLPFLLLLNACFDGGECHQRIDRTEPVTITELVPSGSGRCPSPVQVRVSGYNEFVLSDGAFPPRACLDSMGLTVGSVIPGHDWDEGEAMCPRGFGPSAELLAACEAACGPIGDAGVGD